jgi:thioredoxin reductase
LTLVALRLVLAGKRADDDSVVALRDHALAVRAGGDGAAAALAAYRKVLAIIALAVAVSLALASPLRAQTPSPTPNLYRSLEGSQSAHPAAEIRGKIESVDYPGGTFVIRNGPNRETIAVVPATTIYQQHGGYATFADLHRGQHVDVSVYDVGGRLVAQSIRI